MFMNVQAEYKDLCTRHEHEFCIHLHYILSFIFLENTVKTDNIRIVVQNIKYIYCHGTRLYIVKHTYIYIYLVQVSLPTNFD